MNSFDYILEDIYHQLILISKKCKLCPNFCQVDRTKGKLGFCNSDNKLKIASINIHKGEEPPISGNNGAVNVFFSHCTMRCDYCQNYPISQMGVGKVWSVEEASQKILKFLKKESRIVNLVSPTQQIVQFLPVIINLYNYNRDIRFSYNTSGYESLDVIKVLVNIFKIFLWDIRYFDNNLAYKYSHVQNYFKENIKSLSYIIETLGDELLLDDCGNAKQGVIIRLLVLPDNINKVDEILKYLNESFGSNISISLMNQYFPIYKAVDNPTLNKKIVPQLFDEIKEKLYKYGFNNGWVQEFEEGFC